MKEKTVKQVAITIPIDLHSKLVLLAKAAKRPKTLKSIIIEALEEKVEPLDGIENLDVFLASIEGLSK